MIPRSQARTVQPMQPTPQSYSMAGAVSPGRTTPFTVATPPNYQQSALTQRRGQTPIPGISSYNPSSVTIGKKGFTPGEIVNYASNEEAGIQKTADQRQQQALDFMGGQYGQAQGFDPRMSGMYDSMYQRNNKLGNNAVTGAANTLTNRFNNQLKEYSAGNKANLAEISRGYENSDVMNKQTLQDQLGSANKYYSDSRGTLSSTYGDQRMALGQAKTDNLGYVNQLGQQQYGRIQDNYRKANASDSQRMASRGLGNSSVLSSMNSKNQRDREDARLGIDEMRARATMGINDTYASGVAGAAGQYGQNVAGLNNAQAGLTTGIYGNAADRNSALQNQRTGNIMNTNTWRADQSAAANANYGQQAAALALNNRDFGYGNNNQYQQFEGSHMGAQQDRAMNYGSKMSDIIMNGRLPENNAKYMANFASPKVKSNIWGGIAGTIGGGLLGSLTGGIGTGLSTAAAGWFNNKKQ